jgi:DNA-directed RNA polymerase subunit RPC12/RpoP
MNDPRLVEHIRLPCARCGKSITGTYAHLAIRDGWTCRACMLLVVLKEGF